MSSLIDKLKARRRLFPPLIWLAAAAVDHVAFSSENTSFLLTMAIVAVFLSAPASWYEYRPRRRP